LHQVYHQYQQASLTGQIDHQQASPSHSKADSKNFITSLSALLHLLIVEYTRTINNTIYAPRR
jgi:hypothetical protein